MKNWQKRYPPYEGEEPYLYLAFAEADSAKVWKLMKLLLSRGCRVWYCCGLAGSAEELLRRQSRAGGAALTMVYLTDAAIADKDTKSYVLVNQKFDEPILCLDPDGVDRRLSMGLREDTPHIPLYSLKKKEEIESAILHAEGFSQEMLGVPVRIVDTGPIETLTRVFLTLALLLLAVGFVGFRYFHWFEPPMEDEVVFTDPAILSSVRALAQGGPITQELIDGVTVLSLDALPESWDELALLPSLERVALPQREVLKADALPEGYTIELRGGEGA